MRLRITQSNLQSAITAECFPPVRDQVVGSRFLFYVPFLTYYLLQLLFFKIDCVQSFTVFCTYQDIVISKSALLFCKTSRTPFSPAVASPYIHGRATSTPFAPSAIAFIISEPRRMPLSIKTGILSCTTSHTSGSASNAATAPST